MAGCTRCGSLVDGAGMCTDPSCRAMGGNDGILQHKKNNTKGGSRCWVATAYYGDANHPDVEILRRWRNRLIGNSKYGRMFVLINNFYHKIGMTKFGDWWALKTLPNSSTLARTVSKHLLSLALFFSRNYSSHKR